MHRHGYQGKKFGRIRDQRQALLSGLANSLIRDESIETTHSKAKELVPYLEKLITKAKKNDLHNRRQIISDLQSVSNANKLIDEIGPKLKGRTSGHLRVVRTTLRRGDNTQLAKISFVDDLKKSAIKEEKTPELTKTVQTKPKDNAKPVAKKTKVKA
jgi:large subunit ribosomal protein L17